MRKARPPLAIIDIGSNSARVVVYNREAGGHLRIVASARSSLRLVEGVVENHAIGEEAMERARDALRDFRAIALGAGAHAIRVYATAAVREASDGDRFARLVARTIKAPLQILDGEAEALYGFHGALRGLQATSGLLFDLGGGSLQLTQFRQRTRVRSWSVPLGALRLSRRYLERDPPTEKQVRSLRSHIDGFLEELPLKRLPPGSSVVGTGGTVRNLAKIERFRLKTPGSRLHGHELSRLAIDEIEADLRSLPRRKRADVLGLSKDRSDSIVAGAVVIGRLLDYVDADEILVSGQGLREGLAYAALGEMDAEPARVRATSIEALLSRFRGVDGAHGRRRAEIAATLFRRLVLRAGDRGRFFAAALDCAARVLDIGRAVDFFDRHEHAARIVLASELDGFSQAEVARIAAVLHAADEEGIDLDEYEPLVTDADRTTVERAAVILLLADDLLERAPRGTTPQLGVSVRGDTVVVRASRVSAWRPRGLGDRFLRTFKKDLFVEVQGKV
jgi:exopolyphosphatase/guanosine-5'-triphosphate,3'-diphosphate pyrophosphatase